MKSKSNKKTTPVDTITLKKVLLIVVLIPLIDIILSFSIGFLFHTYSFPTLSNIAFQNRWLDSSSSRISDYLFFYLVAVLVCVAFINQKVFKIVVPVVFAVAFVHFGLPMIDRVVTDYKIDQANKKRHRVVNALLKESITVSDVLYVHNKEPNSSQLTFAVNFDKEKLLPEFDKLQIRLSSRNGKFSLYTHSFELSDDSIQELLQIQKAVYNANITFEASQIKYDLRVNTEFSDQLRLEIEIVNSNVVPGTDLIIPLNT